jgi:hypothetical protein
VSLTLAVKSISYVPASARIFGCGVLGHGDYRAPNCQQQVEVCHITATLDNSETIYEFARPVVNSITNHQPSCVVEVGKTYPARWWKTQRGIYVQSTSIDKRGNVRHGDMDFELKGARMQ